MCYNILKDFSFDIGKISYGYRKTVNLSETGRFIVFHTLQCDAFVLYFDKSHNFSYALFCYSYIISMVCTLSFTEYGDLAKGCTLFVT